MSWSGSCEGGSREEAIEGEYNPNSEASEVDLTGLCRVGFGSGTRREEFRVGCVGRFDIWDVWEEEDCEERRGQHIFL